MLVKLSRGITSLLGEGQSHSPAVCGIKDKNFNRGQVEPQAQAAAASQKLSEQIHTEMLVFSELQMNFCFCLHLVLVSKNQCCSQAEAASVI